MDSNEHLNKVTCSSIEVCDSHYLKQPINLQCGHAVCRNCIPINGNQPIKCKKCGNVTDMDLSNERESAGFKMLLKCYLPQLFIDIEKRFSDGIATIKSMAKSQDETLDVKAKYIEEEIEIQVESIKIELDQLESRLKHELAQIVKEMKQDQTYKKFDEMQIATFESKLDELRNDLKNYQIKNEEKFYVHQECFKSLKQSIKQLEELGFSYQMQFIPSTIKLNTDFIGKFKLKLTGKIKEKLQSSNYETFELDVNPIQLHSLRNKQFILINANGITLYYENFIVIRSLTSIENQALSLFGIAFNSKNEIYISDNSKNCILKLDLSLNKIKSFGTLGNNSYQLKRPFGICYKNDRLYVCDGGNNRIQILNEDLEYVDTINIDFRPLAVCISSTTIGVSNNGTGTYFYDINTKQLKNKYPSVVGRISEIDSYFLVLSYKQSVQLSIFDKEGALIAQVKLDRFNDLFSSHWDGHLSLINGNLFMTIASKRQILKF